LLVVAIARNAPSRILAAGACAQRRQRAAPSLILAHRIAASAQHNAAYRRLAAARKDRQRALNRWRRLANGMRG